MNGTIVLGLDGANWPLVEPWIEGGELPNLAALREQAAWGPLASQLPPVTSPNWRCYATGRNPAKLGVFWWEIVDREQREIRHPSSRDFHTRPYWDELADAGRSVAVLNFPSGYPPSPIKGGRFTAGGPGAKDEGFSFPAEWEQELRERYGYRVHPVDVLRSATQVESRVDEILALMQSRFDVAFDLLDEEPDLLHITLFYINVLHHFWYRGEPTLAGWKLIDRNLGQLRQVAEQHHYNLMLMSDHGCGPVDTVFFINTWLAQEGYLVANVSQAARRLSQLGLDRQRLIGLARRLGLAPLLRRLIPSRVQRALPSADGTFSKEAKGDLIDWERSRAVASGQGPIYLLVSPDAPEFESLRREIADKLRTLRNPLTGKPVANRVFTRDEVYNGPFVDQAPDLIFEQAPGIHTSGGVGHPLVFAPPEKWAADNVVEGLFLAWGPDYAASGYVEGTRIVDLSPTILHQMGMSVPDDMDGRVLQDLFALESEARNRSVVLQTSSDHDEKAYSDEDEDEIASRLSALGYLD